MPSADAPSPTEPASALHPLLLAIDRGFDAARGARIFPRHLAKAAQAASFSFSAASDCPSRSKRVGRLRRFVEFGGHAEEGFGGIAILLALEKALAEPVLRIRRSGDRSDISARNCAWSLRPAHNPCAACSRCRDRTRPSALPRAARWSSRVPTAGGRGGRHRRRIAVAGGVGEIERLAGPAAAGSADRRLGRNRKLAAAERARRTGSIRILAGVESIAAAPARRQRRPGRLLHDRRWSGNLRLLIGRVAGTPDRAASAAPPRCWAGQSRAEPYRAEPLQGCAPGAPCAALKRLSGAPRAAGCGIAVPRSGRSVAAADSRAAEYAFPDRHHRIAPSACEASASIAAMRRGAGNLMKSG